MGLKSRFRAKFFTKSHKVNKNGDTHKIKIAGLNMSSLKQQAGNTQLNLLREMHVRPQRFYKLQWG